MLNSQISITASTLGQVTFTTHYAQYGGVIYVDSTTGMTLTNIQFTSSYANFGGGVLAAVSLVSNPSQGAITMTTCILSSSTSKGYGGAFYFSTKQLSQFNFIGSKVYTATSTYDGGVFWTGKFNGVISVTGSLFQTFSAPNPYLGSLYFSDTASVQFKLLSSTVTCTTVAFTAATALSEITVGTYSSTTKAGAIYFGTSTAGITSSGNTFSNCHNLGDGGIYYIDGSTSSGNTALTESNNTYTNIYALYGSIMKCSNCKFTIANSTMDGSRAYSGGAFFVENQAGGTVTNTSLKNVMAVTQGGVMSVI